MTIFTLFKLIYFFNCGTRIERYLVCLLSTDLGPYRGIIPKDNMDYVSKRASGYIHKVTDLMTVVKCDM